jgi:hypothetical protein
MGHILLAYWILYATASWMVEQWGVLQQCVGVVHERVT